MNYDPELLRQFAKTAWWGVEIYEKNHWPVIFISGYQPRTKHKCAAAN
jgi:hypothetical protein